MPESAAGTGPNAMEAGHTTPVSTCAAMVI